MYIQVWRGWRYHADERTRVVTNLEKERAENGGQLPLRPNPPGLIARMFGTDPADPDTGIAIWVWESEEAAAAYRWDATPESRERIQMAMDTTNAVTEGYDGLYFAHR